MKLSYWFILICLAFFSLAFAIENLNGSFLLNDFRVYYDASCELLSGANPYGQAYGLSSGFYKYAPVTLLFFSPATIFTFETAKILHFIVISLCSIMVFLLCLSLARHYLPRLKKNETLFLSLLLIFSSVHLTRELHLGNINQILILLTLSSLSLVKNNKPRIAAIFLAVLFLLKPYFLILILPILAYRKFGILAQTALIVTALCSLLFLFFGYETTVFLHKNWFNSMMNHSSSLTSEHTFTSIFRNYTGIVLSARWTYIFIGIVTTIYLFSRWFYIFGRKKYTPGLFLSDTFILLALIPNMVLTDSQHFLFSIPLLALILAHLFTRPDWKMTTLFIVLFFFYGMNSNDLLGNPLSNKFDDFSTIGVANLMLAGLFIVIRKKENSTSF